MTIEHVQQLAEMVGGKIESAGVAPDGSGFATMSIPISKTHWIFEKGPDGFQAPPPMPFRLGTSDPRHEEWVKKIWEAGKYAVRGATMCGEAMDFDPDALVQNLVVGLIGYHTPDGLSGESWSDPDPVPPVHPHT